MPNIVTPIQRPPQGRKLFWGREDVAVGTPPVGGAGHNIFVEGITNFDVNDQRDIYTAAEVTGAMSDSIGQDELTHYVQATLTSPFRAHGITAQMLACLMGNQTYTPSGGAGAFSHAIPLAPLTNRTNTLTAWWQTTVDPAAGGSGYTKQMTRMTVQQVQLTFGAGSALDVSATVWGSWPTYAVPPITGVIAGTIQTGSTTGSIILAAGQGGNFTAGQTITVTGETGTITVSSIAGDTLTVAGGTGTPTVGGTVAIAGATTPIYVGNDAVYTITRTLGYQGSFTIYGSSGALYTPRIISGTMTVSRPAEAVYAADSQTIVDIALGPLTLQGDVVFQFDGYNPATIARDYSDYKPSGSSANKNVFKWTDADGNFVSFTTYPMKWNPFTLDFSGQYVKGNGTFTANNDPATVMAASPVLTVLNPLTLRNGIATAMIGP